MRVEDHAFKISKVLLENYGGKIVPVEGWNLVRL
jgi:hypothetical protein